VTGRTDHLDAGHITRRYPDSYGVENLAPATLGQQLAWPIFPGNKQGGNGVKKLTAMEAAMEAAVKA